MAAFACFERFRRNAEGAAAVLFAFSIPVLIGIVGMAVDGGRWFMMRSQHSAAIDSGLLAGARFLQSNPSDIVGAMASAQKFYKANLSAGVDVVDDTVTFVTTDNDQTVTFTGTASIGSTFLGIIGIPKLQISVPAKAVLAQSGLNQGSDIEIAVMLDVTGSMCDDGTGPCTSSAKLNGVKSAVTNLATIVLGQSTGSYKSRIALVPFSSAVRIDADGSKNPVMQVLTGQPQNWSGWQANLTCTGGSGYWSGEFYVWTSYPTCTQTSNYVSNWLLKPCVTERTFDSGIGFDPSDSAPGAANWLLGHGGDRFPVSMDSTDAAPYSVGNASNPGYSGKVQADPTWQWDYSPDGSGCTIQPGNEILPLTGNLSAIKSRINTLTGYGPTAGALGTIWAQYLLSPKWNGIFGSGAAAGSYADTQTKQANGAPVLRKIAVLMTDGGFNTYRQATYDYASDGGAQMKSVSDRAIKICANMKANGVEIYTVGFNLNALSSGEQAIATATLQACGTDLSHFYNSLDVAQLNAAFKDIAVKLTPVRLVN